MWGSDRMTSLRAITRNLSGAGLELQDTSTPTAFGMNEDEAGENMIFSTSVSTRTFSMVRAIH